jgi:hypothetical protein
MPGQLMTPADWAKLTHDGGCVWVGAKGRGGAICRAAVETGSRYCPKHMVLAVHKGMLTRPLGFAAKKVAA